MIKKKLELEKLLNFEKNNNFKLNSYIKDLEKKVQLEQEKMNKNGKFHDLIVKSPIFKDVLNRAKLKLIFKASENNFSAAKFHEAVDNISFTITVVETPSGLKIGGFNNIAWVKRSSSGTNYLKDYSYLNFLFSLTHNSKHRHFRYPERAIAHDPNDGPRFGGGSDLYISNECNKKEMSYIHLGNTYEVGNNSNFANKVRFYCEEYEVYKITYDI